MGNLRVDYPALAEKIDRLQETFIKADEQICLCAAAAEELDIFWDGDANAAFISRIGDDLADAAAVLIRIRDVIGKAGKAFDHYMKNENDVKRMIGESRL